MHEGSTKEAQLSPQQKHLWLLQKAHPDRHYRAQATVMLEGQLNPTLLHAAFEQVVQRHDILRTSFQQVPWLKLPVQAIAAHAALALERVDLSMLDPDTQEQQLDDLRRSAAYAPFDLTQAPVLRAWLITVAPTRHVLLLSLPALYGDTTTLANLVRELSQTYAASVQGTDLADEPLQYPDLAEILNELVEAENTEAGASYWRAHHAAGWPRLRLSFARPHPGSAANDPLASVRLQLQPEETAQIQALSPASASSTATVLLSCWYALLWRLTEQPEIVVGVAYDGRTYEGMDTALGLLARNLPLRCRIAPDMRVEQLLAQVSQVMGEVYEWQDYFTWKHLEAPERDEAQPLCPFSFEFIESPDPITVAGVTFTLHACDAAIDAYQIKLSAIHTSDGRIELIFHYDPTLFQQRDVELLADQLYMLLTGIPANLQTELARVEMTSPAERQRLVVDYNATSSAYPASSSAHQLFEEQVMRTPDACAVIFDGQQITYAQLNARANQLARYLRGRGVGPDVLVALCVERSPELVVALLGVLKAGGAYVPLDPAYPQERLALILEDTQAPVVLTQQHLRARLPRSAAKLVDLSADWSQLAAENPDNLSSLVQPDNLAYVIYTSGSTGKPKGTMVQHRSLVNYLAWCTAAYNVQYGQGTLVHSSIGFDLTVTSLWAPLLVGQAMTLVPEHASIEGLVAALRGNQHFSLIKITPTHLDLLNQMLPTEQLTGSVQALVIGGESLRHEALTFWRTYAPGTRLINEYGPTETVVGCSVYEVTDEPPLGSSIPIGRPIANTQLYVLDQYGQLTPSGSIGELYIGGVGVTRGYLNRPDLTAEKFVPDPFSPTPGARLYRSGDLARYLPDGNLEFIGRNDHQIKLHGFRIELGEIEAVLAGHLRVRDVVVVARETTPGNTQLVAYVVEDKHQTAAGNQQDAADSQLAVPAGGLSSSELRGFLQERLPEHMIPAHVVLLDALPLTTNGKVDRAALPAPSVEHALSDPASGMPSTPVEAQLVAIWQEVLRLERVGIHDNFFELGGDSILSIQIVAKANKAGIQLQPKHLFDHRTIAELAAVAASAPKIQAEQGLITGSAPLTPIQHWFFEQSVPEPHHWNQTLLLEARQRLDPALVEQAVQQILTHHDALRLRFTRHADGTWTQHHAAPEATPPFRAISLAALPSAEQTTAITAHATDFQASLDLADGPVMRVAYFDLGADQPGRLLIVAHHLVVDGVSWRILLEDLQTAYDQLTRGEAVTLPPKTTSFKHWAERLAAYAQQSAVATELTHWLAEAQTSRSLPTDQPAAPDARAVAHTEIVSVMLDAAATQALVQEVPAAYNTQINDVLITALAQAFAQWTGAQTLSLNLEGHGREDLFEDVNLSRTVGWFTTIFPVLVDLRGVDGPGNALKAVKEQLRRVPQRGIGYGLLRYLRRDDPVAPQLARLPEAEVSFNYLGQMDQVVSDGLFGPAYESSGPARSPRGHRRYLLEINGGLLNGQLRVDWTYSSQAHQRATIEAVANSFIAELKALIAHCQSPGAGSYTPSDFPDEDLSADDLDKILAQISKF